MADRVDFYFRQRITDAELDLAFAFLEKTDPDLAAAPVADPASAAAR